MSEIKKDVAQVIYGAFAITLILIVVATLFFGCSGDSMPIKSAFSLMGNYVGAIATLAAAYIASLLFNDWRDQVKEKRKEYFILKYLEYLDYMNQLLFNLTFHHRDFEDKELFNAKVAYFISSLTTQHMQAGSRLKAIAQDNKLNALIDEEAEGREPLMKKYLNDIVNASKKRKTNPNAIKDTLDLYSGQNCITSVYKNIISKNVSDYCLKKLTSFDD